MFNTVIANMQNLCFSSWHSGSACERCIHQVFCGRFG